MIGLAGSGERKNPYPFSFSNTTGVAASTVVSTSIVPAGFNGALTAVVSGSGSPGVRKNNSGSFGSSVVLFPGDTLNLQMTSAGAYSTPVTCTVTMGTLSASWTVTTGVVTPGSQNFTTPGTYNFTVPNYNSMTIEVKGAGQGGGSSGGPPSLSGGKVGHCTGGTPAKDDGLAGGQSSFGPSLIGPGGIIGANGLGTGGNVLNDSAGAAGGDGQIGGSDPDCGSGEHGPTGHTGGRAKSTFSIGGLTVGTGYTVAVGNGGPSFYGTYPTGAGANGSVTISWT